MNINEYNNAHIAERNKRREQGISKPLTNIFN